MPELPEVTTIINTLKNTSILHKKIDEVILYHPKVLKNCSAKVFINFLIGECIEDISRKGKYIIVHLSHNKYWLIHLRMEGKLFYQSLKKGVEKTHLMVQINFTNNYFLGYYDSRMFGTFHIFLSLDALNSSKELMSVGYDPYDQQMTGEYLYEKIHHLRINIKAAIMDQSIISGIGNIYACEILFKAKLHPLTKCCNLSLTDCKNIIKYAKLIMDQSIKHQGTTVFSYQFDQNHTGQFQKYLLVYGRSNQSCYTCHNLIEKIKVNQRGTYFCPHCQQIKE